MPVTSDIKMSSHCPPIKANVSRFVLVSATSQFEVLIYFATSQFEVLGGQVGKLSY